MQGFIDSFDLLDKLIMVSDIAQASDEDVNVKDDYVSCGLIDSLGVFELVFELEDQFSFKFTDDDFKHPHFRTIYGMTQLIINRKQSL